MPGQRHRWSKLPLGPCERAKQEGETEQQHPYQIKPHGCALEGETQAHRPAQGQPDHKKKQNKELLHAMAPDTGVNRGMQETITVIPEHPETLKPLFNILTSRISVRDGSGFTVEIVRSAFRLASYSAGIFRRR